MKAAPSKNLDYTGGKGVIKSLNQEGNKELDAIRNRYKENGWYDDTDYQYDNSHVKINSTVSPEQARINMSRAMDPSNYPGGCPPWAKCIGGGNNPGLGGQNVPRSAQIVGQALNGLRDVGTNGLQAAAKNAASQSMMSRLLDGPEIKPDEDLPSGPGFAYLNHLFKATGAGDKLKQNQKNALTKGLNVMTNAMDGVRTALKMIGLAGDQNIDGLPIDAKDALKIFHGDRADDMDDLAKNEFMRELGDGTTKIDRKKIRKFVNLDGSLTWEILNDDKKSVMSRFTFGEYNGTKLFAQGGYKQFAELLRDARKKLGTDYRGEFDDIRRSY